MFKFNFRKIFLWMNGNSKLIRLIILHKKISLYVKSVSVFETK